jgi:hypothetical protein
MAPTAFALRLFSRTFGSWSSGWLPMEPNHGIEGGKPEKIPRWSTHENSHSKRSEQSAYPTFPGSRSDVRAKAKQLIYRLRLGMNAGRCIFCMIRPTATVV